MLTEFLRDQTVAIAWLAFMAAGWFGYSQEDPKPKFRGWLGAGSVLGFLLAIAFGILSFRNWNTASALDGQYWVFGVVVVAEVVVIGAGCWWLAHRKAARWYGWWVGFCVALHFLPLAWVFGDWSYVALTVVQVVGLLWMLPMLRRGDYPTSRWAAPWVALTFLIYAAISAVIALAKYGYPY